MAIVASVVLTTQGIIAFPMALGLIGTFTALGQKPAAVLRNL